MELFLLRQDLAIVILFILAHILADHERCKD
jgi:hypothetical protein